MRRVSMDKKASGPEVGIFWIAKGSVLAISLPDSECDPDDIVCISEEHFLTWEEIKKIFAQKIPEIVPLKYNELERGRVWYDTVAKKYNITLSSALKQNDLAVQLIKKEFGIEAQRVSIVRDPQYDHCEIKVTPI